MTDGAKEWANKNSCCIDGGKCCANVTEAFQAGYEKGFAEQKEKIKLLENTCAAWQEIQKTDNELLHEFEKENVRLKSLVIEMSSFIRSEQHILNLRDKIENAINGSQQNE